jgi:predicted nucleic acid-binding Zn ribbon protein
MRCSHCGKPLEPGVCVCPRCRANVSADARRHELKTTCIFVLVSIALMALMLLFILTWEGSLLFIPNR